MLPGLCTNTADTLKYVGTDHPEGTKLNGKAVEELFEAWSS